MWGMIVALLGFILTITVVVYGYQRIGRLVITYKIGKDDVTIALLNRIPVVRIPLSNIVEVEEVSFSRTNDPYFRTLRFGNRMLGNYVKIRIKSGVFLSLIVTPDDPPEFVRNLRGAIALSSAAGNVRTS